MERHNPVNPKAQMRTGVYGRGATPSMGLSQFRGGSYEKLISVRMSSNPSRTRNHVRDVIHAQGYTQQMENYGALPPAGTQKLSTPQRNAIISALNKIAATELQSGLISQDEHDKFVPHGGAHMASESESDEEMEGGGSGGMTRMVGAGRKGMTEATQMGLHLGKHLHSLHGAGFFDDFKQGFNSVFTPVASIAKSVLPLAGPQGMAASGVLGALGYGHAKKGARGRPRKGGATNSDTGAYEGHGRERDDRVMTGMGTGGGFLSDLGIPVVSDLAGMVGMGTGAGTGGRKKRAPAGANDGRRKRAEVVKKVMADKGLSMIDASKYVKAHNLY